MAACLPECSAHVADDGAANRGGSFVDAEWISCGEIRRRPRLHVRAENGGINIWASDNRDARNRVDPVSFSLKPNLHSFTNCGDCVRL